MLTQPLVFAVAGIVALGLAAYYAVVKILNWLAGGQDDQ